MKVHLNQTARLPPWVALVLRALRLAEDFGLFELCLVFYPCQHGICLMLEPFDVPDMLARKGGCSRKVASYESKANGSGSKLVLFVIP